MALRAKDGRWLTGSLGKVLSAEDPAYGLIMSTVPKTTAATTLADFGYAYVKAETPSSTSSSSKASPSTTATVLRTVADPTKGFQWLGQKHYDVLGSAIVEELYTQLEGGAKGEKEGDHNNAFGYGLERVMVPLPKQTQNKEGGASSSSKATAAATVSKTARKEAQVPIFMSPNVLAAATGHCSPHAPAGEDGSPSTPSITSSSAAIDTLLVIMQGSGAVRPGMWARALCMNASLEEGTIYSYLDKARERGWGVIVTNPNENTVPLQDAAALSAAEQQQSNTKKKGAAEGGDADAAAVAAAVDVERFWLGTPDAQWKAFAAAVNKASEPVRGSETPMDHSQYVYEHFVIPAKPKRVLIVAHSFGGICVGSLFRSDNEKIRKHLVAKCPAIAFTDACNDVTAKDAAVMRDFYKRNVINWIASTRPLNKPMGLHKGSGCEERSAGHPQHESTSACCVEPLFEWLDAKLEASLKK